MTDSAIPFLLVNLLFASVALTIGFIAGGWLLGGFSGLRQRRDHSSSSTMTAEEKLNRTLALERTAMASERLRDLASGVAIDVGRHSHRVEEITADLQALDLTDVESMGNGLVQGLAEIVAANAQLQQQLAIAEQQIQSQADEIRAHETEARTDSLTGLANRRAFDVELNRRFSEWERKGTCFSLLIFDLDFFKRLNDSYGHPAGDEVLRRIGNSLCQTSREMDLCCRYGGEEFAVIMPATNAEEGQIGAERIRQAIEALKITFEGTTLPVTASIGLASVAPGDTTERLLKRADEALYASKAAGRNCAHWHDGQASLPFPGEHERPLSQPVAQDSKAPTAVLDQLPNRTQFADELRRRITACEESGFRTPLAVIAFEVEGYKELPRRWGASTDCLALEAVAQLLSQATGKHEFLASLSEGQFVMLLQGSDAMAAGRVAHRLQQGTANCAIPTSKGIHSLDLQIEIQAGVAELNSNDTVETLVSRALASVKSLSAASASM